MRCSGWVIAAGRRIRFRRSRCQLYKERGKDLYIGGPAYYMQRGLNARWLGLIFVGFIVLGPIVLYVHAVQTNAIVEAGANSFNISIEGTDGMGSASWWVIIMKPDGGHYFRWYSYDLGDRVSGAVYGGAGTWFWAFWWWVWNIGEIPNVLLMIFEGALVCVSLWWAARWVPLFGVAKRGSFSNEAGMGTAPNAGATAIFILHPAKQGYVQALGVYFDTMLVCFQTAYCASVESCLWR